MLPPLLPTSFEAKHGSIRYLINVVIDRPWKFDLTYKNAFTVLKQLDLNYENPALKIPTKMEIVKTFYCFLCKSKPLYMAASIPVSGYVCGQNIVVSIEMNNESNINVDDVKISLKKIIYYNSQRPTTKTKTEVLSEAELRCGAVGATNKIKFEQKLIIPPVPPSNMNYCRILNVTYEVHVTAKVSGMHTNPVIKLPITIGTVPLITSMPSQQSFPVQQPTAPAITPTGQYNFAETFSDVPANGSQHQPMPMPSTGDYGKTQKLSFGRIFMKVYSKHLRRTKKRWAVPCSSTKRVNTPSATGPSTQCTPFTTSTVSHLNRVTREVPRSDLQALSLLHRQTPQLPYQDRSHKLASFTSIDTFHEIFKKLKQYQ